MDLYSINLRKIQLTEYQQILKNKEILPGRIILKEDIEKNFKKLSDNSITNLGDLNNVLKTKNKLELFAQKTQLTIEYLRILRRDINAFISKPVNLKEFPSISKNLISVLSDHGIIHTKYFFELSIHEQDRLNMQRLL